MWRKCTLTVQRRAFLWSKDGTTSSLEATDTPLLHSAQGETKVFLDFEAGQGNTLGRVEIELNAEAVPMATENFLALCTGVYAKIPAEGVDRDRARTDRSLKLGNLHYQHTNIHRVMPGFLIQGGDNEHYDGTGGFCSFPGLKYFEDESYEVTFDEPGVVGMAATAPNRNASQFFITTAPAPHLNGSCVGIGRVTAGMEVVRQIEQLETDHMDKPLQHVKIINCGLASAA